MANQTVMQLLLELKDEVSNKLHGVERNVEGFSRSLRSTGASANFLAGALKGAIGAFSLIEVGAFIKGIGESADQLLDLSQQLNISTKSLQQWKNVMIATGSDAGLFEKAIVKLTEVIGAAEAGFPKALKALKLLGPEFIKLVESGAPVEQVFEQALAVISEMESPTQRAAAITKIFGNELQELTNVANEGTEAIAKLKEEGPIIDEDDLKRAQELNTRFDVLVNTINVGLKNALFSAVDSWNAYWDSTRDPERDKGGAGTGFIGDVPTFASMTGAGKTTPKPPPPTPRLLVDKAAESAVKNTASKAAAAAAKEAADRLKEIQDLRKGIIDLHGGLDPLYAESVRLTSAENLLTIALEKGLITQQRAQEIRVLLTQSTIAAKDAVTAAKEAEEAHNKVLDEGKTLTESVMTLEEQRNAELERSRVLLEGAAISNETYNRSVAEINTRFDELVKKAGETTDQMTEFSKQAARNMEDAFASFFFDIMQGNFTDLVGNFKRTIDRMVADLLASKLLTFLLGGFGETGNLGGLAGSLFAGARQKGGPVVGGRSYLVGETGPELFVPGGSGQIQPSGAGGVVNISIKAMDSQDVRRSLEQNKRWIAETVFGTGNTFNLKPRGA